MKHFITKFKDKTGNIVYPVTSSDAVGMSDGSGNLTKKLGEIEKEKENIPNIISSGIANEKVNCYLQQIIGKDGSVMSWGAGCATDFLNLNRLIYARNIKACNTEHAVVAFYDSNKSFLPEYNKYIATAGKTFGNITLSKDLFPKAEYCKISFDMTVTDSAVYQYSLSDNVGNINELLTDDKSSVVKSINEIYNRRKQDVNNVFGGEKIIANGESSVLEFIRFKSDMTVHFVNVKISEEKGWSLEGYDGNKWNFIKRGIFKASVLNKNYILPKEVDNYQKIRFSSTDYLKILSGYAYTITELTGEELVRKLDTVPSMEELNNFATKMNILDSSKADIGSAFGGQKIAADNSSRRLEFTSFKSGLTLHLVNLSRPLGGVAAWKLQGFNGKSWIDLQDLKIDVNLTKDIVLPKEVDTYEKIAVFCSNSNIVEGYGYIISDLTAEETVQKINAAATMENYRMMTNRISSLIVSPLEIEAYIPNNSMTTEGSAVPSAYCHIYKIPIDDSCKAVKIKKIKGKNGPSMLVGWFKQKDVLVLPIVKAKANEEFDSVVLWTDERPSDAEYILFYSFEQQYKPEIFIFRPAEQEKKIHEIENNLAKIGYASNSPIFGLGDSIGSQILASMEKYIGTIDGRKIINGCVGGEGVTDSLARVGVVPYVVLPFTIPASTSKSEPITVYSSRFIQTNIGEDGESKTYINTYKKGYDGLGNNPYGEGLNPWNSMKCSIGGIKGTLYFQRSNPERDSNYFIRDVAGQQVIFDRPQLVIKHREDLPSTQSTYIAFLGTNTGWSPETTRENFEQSADLLVNYYEQLKNSFNHENYVFLGFYMTAYIDACVGTERVKKWKYFEDKMVEKFGKHYFSVRQYLREYGWKDAGYQLGYRLVNNGDGTQKYTCLPEDISEDIQGIKDGRIPYCITNHSVHMLRRASACVANQVVKRLYELGCIKSCPQIDISAIKDAENADINEPDYNNK